MMLNKINTIERYVEIVEQYRSKEGASNDYLQREAETLINNGELFEVCDRHNAFLFVKKILDLECIIILMILMRNQILMNLKM